mgnify:CR=1 FL=1
MYGRIVPWPIEAIVLWHEWAGLVVLPAALIVNDYILKG